MHKKLMAAAVAGVLAAPVIAQAQSTVQIYGVAEWEYGVLEQGNGRPRVDYNEVTGSYLGFRGTESLGGGLSAWFQCETTMDIRAFDQVGLCWVRCLGGCRPFARLQHFCRRRCEKVLDLIARRSSPPAHYT